MVTNCQQKIDRCNKDPTLQQFIIATYSTKAPIGYKLALCLTHGLVELEFISAFYKMVSNTMTVILGTNKKVVCICSLAWSYFF